jgi:hypothetical protein
MAILRLCPITLSASAIALSEPTGLEGFRSSAPDPGTLVVNTDLTNGGLDDADVHMEDATNGLGSSINTSTAHTNNHGKCL